MFPVQYPRSIPPRSSRRPSCDILAKLSIALANDKLLCASGNRHKASEGLLTVTEKDELPRPGREMASVRRTRRQRPVGFATDKNIVGLCLPRGFAVCAHNNGMRIGVV